MEFDLLGRVGICLLIYMVAVAKLFSRIAARAVAASGIGIPFFFIVALVGTVLVFAGRWFIGFTLVGISFIGIPSSVLLVKLLRKPEPDRSTSWR